MSDDRRPCGCPGATTTAPEMLTECHAFSTVCDHGMQPWESVKNLTGGDDLLVLGLAASTSITAICTANERGLPIHTRLFLFCYATHRSETDTFCGIEIAPTGWLNLVWDPCEHIPLGFHGRMSLSQWTLEQMNSAFQW